MRGEKSVFGRIEFFLGEGGTYPGHYNKNVTLGNANESATI